MPHLSRLTLTLDQSTVAKQPVPPWQADNQLAAPPRTMEEIAFDGFDTLGSPPSMDDAHKWFTTVQGGINPRDWNGVRMPVLDGVNRLNAPLSEDSVLRMSLVENQWLTLHFWHGKTGLTLRTYPEKGQLVAYRVDRSNPNQPLRTLAATDWDRGWRTNPTQMPMRFDLRFHKGMFVVSRGDIELLRAPYEGLPDEVIFEGHGIFRALSLVRTNSELPAEPAAAPIAQDFARPADLNWATELPKEIQFNKLPDGSVELRSQQSQQAGWIATPLPEGGLGLRELIVELDDVSPCTDIGLGSGKGEPKQTVGFFRDNQNLSCRWNGFGDATVDCGVDYDHAGRGSAYVAKHQWLMFTGGAGLKCYMSLDGVHWTPWLTTNNTAESHLTHLTIWMAQAGMPRSIKLRRVTLRKLETIDSLAGPELLAKAPLVAAGDLKHWNDEVARLQPPGTARGAWRRACAVKTIAAGGHPDQIRPIMDQLLDEVLALPRPIDEQFARLNEMALVLDVIHNAQGAEQFARRYEQLADRVWREGNTKPWTTAFRAIAYSPLWCEYNYTVRLDRAARAELLSAIYSDDVPQAEKSLAAIRLSGAQDPLLMYAGDWLSRHGGNDMLAERQPGRTMKPASHPLVEELNKEGFNLLGDFTAALESKAYRDACQLITSADGGESLGLWPDPRDPGLYVSVNGALDLALKNDPDLRKTMTQEFGPLGMLQVKQAMGEADGPAVAAVVNRFRGTDAAAMASEWLGDRALSTGDFSKARTFYAQAIKIGGLNDPASVAARDRLAAAMMGQTVGEAAKAPVRMGDVQVSPADFEKLVAEMQRTHGNASFGGSPVPQPAAVAPQPTGFELREVGKIDGEMGQNPGDWNPTNPPHEQKTAFYSTEHDRARFLLPDNVGDPYFRQLDWAGRQMATAADGNILFVSNRFQVAAYDLNSGQKKWHADTGNDHGHTHDWSMTAMRPLIVGDRVFCRQLMNWDNGAPALSAYKKENGEAIWRTRPGLKVASDPLWTSRGLVALTLSQADRQSNLYLSTFDPTNGVIVAQQRLATLRDSWFQHRVCQLSAAGDNLIAVVGGAVMSCDMAGQLRWIRRQEWIGSQEDPDWARQQAQPAIAWKDRLFVAQPGVADVECVDADSGALIWRKVIPGLHRMSGVADDRLIVETQTGFIALSGDKGEIKWNHPAGDLLEGQLCGGPGGFLYARREKGADGQLRPVLVWVDVQTGRAKAYTPLDQLKSGTPMFGPIVAAPNRLIAFSAGGDNDPWRTVFELTPKGPATMVRAGETAGPVTANRPSAVLAER